MRMGYQERSRGNCGSVGGFYQHWMHQGCLIYGISSCIVLESLPVLPSFINSTFLIIIVFLDLLCVLFCLMI